MTKEAKLVHGSVWLKEAGEHVPPHKAPDSAGKAAPGPFCPTNAHSIPALDLSAWRFTHPLFLPPPKHEN